MTGLNEFLAAPVFDRALLSNWLALFAVFLLAVRFLPDFARNLTILLAGIALIESLTSPFYTFCFVAFTGVLYYGLFWIQWSERKKVWCRAIALGVTAFYFLLMDLPLFGSPWTGAEVHHFGISYSLIRLLSVCLDVGNGRPLPSDPLEFFLYAFFPPTFPSGPIERLDDFRVNLTADKRPLLSWGDTGSQLIRIACGLAKGWVALKFLTLDWEAYFNYPQRLPYATLVWGLYARAFGFYMTVSGVNDLIIGTCALAGYRLSENYDYPYFRRNLAEFWRSWHMTLTRFARDYIYIPLGGNRSSVYRNYLIVFLLIGLWHRTTPAFLIWGLWHGLGMCVLRLWKKLWSGIEGRDEGVLRSLQLWSRAHPNLTGLASGVLTFHFVALGWLPFWGGHPQGVGMILRILSGNHWKLFEWVPH